MSGSIMSAEIQPWLRWSLATLLLASALLWSRRRFRAAALFFLLAHCGGLLFWTAQLNEPLGLSSDRTIQARWARIAVSYETRDPAAGYVTGARAAPSVGTFAAAAGLSPRVLEIVGSSMGVVLALAFAFAGSRVAAPLSTRALTALLAVTSGFLWSPLVDLPERTLSDPKAAFVIATCVAALTLLTFGVSWLRAPVRMATAVFICASIAGMLAAGRHDPMVRVRDWTLASLMPAFAIVLTPWVRRVAMLLRSNGFSRLKIEGAILFLLGASSTWFWWDPTRSQPGFEEARSGTPALGAPLEFIRRSVSRTASIASTAPYSALLAGGTGRRALIAPPGTPPGDQPFRRSRLLESLLKGEPDVDLAKGFGVTHLFLGPGEADLPPSARMKLVYSDANGFRVYQIVEPAG